MTSRCVEGISPDRGNPQCFRTGGHRKVVISTKKHKKRTTRKERKQKLKFNPKRVTVWAGMVSGVLLAVKLLVEIIKLIYPN